MKSQPFRLSDGGEIDRVMPRTFAFNGRALEGYAGDTLASALLANGVRLIGRSFKFHRKRGIFGAGAEEPNALVQLEQGARTEPNMRATQIELYEGLVAASQNCWPSVHFDVSAVNDRLSRFMPAGFYYKTFMWPPSWWRHYEHWIRKAAGMGQAPRVPDPDHYAHRYAHCDVLVAGGGPAGLSAALAAARTGARVIIATEDFAWGGSLLGHSADIDGQPARAWVAGAEAELASNPDVTPLLRASVFGYFDHNLIGIAQTVVPRGEHAPRQRLWKVRAKEVVLATGAIERPIVFADNDLPGVMLCSAARTYVNRYAVKPGARAVVFTNNDSAYGAALDFHRAGITVAAIVDARVTGGELARRVRAAGIEVREGHAVVRASGSGKVSSVRIGALEADHVASGSRDIA